MIDANTGIDNASDYNNPLWQDLILQGQQGASALLRDWAYKSDFAEEMESIFGSHNYSSTQTAWREGEIIFPPIEIISTLEQENILGGYSTTTKTIYLSSTLLESYSLEKITAVLLEEYGHYYDDQLNTNDTMGDEGEIFAYYAQQIPLSSSELEKIRLENDIALISINGQTLALQTATLGPISGGYEGSNQTITLDTKGGGSLSYNFEFYNIPDQFIVRYEGKELVNTGFVSGSRRGTVQIPKGNSNQVQVIVATDDEGTAWDYSVETKGCFDTSPLVIEPVGGEFKNEDNDDDCEYNGTVNIGRKDGITSLIRIEGGLVEISEKKVTVTGGTVYSNIGNVSAPLFEGNFEMLYETSSPSAVSDNKRNQTGDFTLAGLDVNVGSIYLRKDSIGLGSNFVLPSEIGYQFNVDSVSTIVDAITIKNSGVGLGFSGKVSLENPPKFSFFDLFDVEASNLSLEYRWVEDLLKLKGKLTMDSFIRDPFETKITIDLASENFVQNEENYVKIQEGKADVKGSLTIETEMQSKTGWGLSEIKLNLDTAQKDISGSTKITFPFRAKIPSVEFMLGFKTPIPPLNFNAISVDVDNLQIPIPTYPLVFFQRFKGGVNNLSADDKDPLEFSGALGATLGPQVNIPKFGNTALIRLDVGGSISSEQASVDGKSFVINEKVLSGEGKKTLNWKDKFYEERGTYSLIDGLIKMDEAGFRADSGFNINMRGTASANVPNFLPLIGGKNLANASALFQFTNNSMFTDDYAQIWTKIQESYFGGRLNIDLNIGLRGYLDGTLETIYSSLPPVGSYLVADGLEYIILVADWENANDTARVRVEKPDGSFIEEADFAANNIAIFNGLTDSDTRAVVIENPVAGIWDLEVVDPTGLGAIEYAGIKPSVIPTVEVINPAETVAGGNVQIIYRSFDSDSDAEIQLFYDTDNDGFNGVLIQGGLEENDGEGNFTWNTQGLATGEYFIYAMVMDENNPPVFDYAPGSVLISEDADIAVDQQVTNSVLDLSQPFTYNLTITNNGAIASQGVILTHTLPTEVTYQSASVNPTTIEGNVLTFDLGNLDAGISQSIQVNVTSAVSPTVLSSQAVVNSNTYDSNFVNNVDYFGIRVQDVPDSPILVNLSVDRTNPANAVALNQNFTYTLTVNNTGDSKATNVTIDDFLPDNVEYISATSSQGTTQYNGRSMIANLGELNGKQSATIEVTLKPLSAGTLIGATTLTSDQLNQGIESESFISVQSVDTGVSETADLSLIQTIDNLNPVVGDTIQITLSITNSGPGTASGIQIRNLLPSGLTFNSFNAIQGSYDATTGIWDLGNMRNGISRELTISATVNQNKRYSIDSEVIAVAETDPDSIPNNGSNNEDDFVSTVLNSSLPSAVLDDPFYRFQNTAVPGTYLFAGETESQSIRDNYPQFEEEGFAFFLSDEEQDGLIRFNRFQNTDVPGTYLFAGDAESESIRTSYPQFEEEGIAFYAFDSGSSEGVPFYRFQNTDLAGTYLFVGEAERQSIIANYPQFHEEGVAFRAII